MTAILPLLLLFLPTPYARVEECFERVRNHTLIGVDVVTLHKVSELQCKHACLHAKMQSCRSFIYHTTRARCFLSSEDRETRDSDFIQVLDAIDYYHRMCYHRTSLPVVSSQAIQRDTVFDDKCYETFKGKVLIGIVDKVIQDVTSVGMCRKRCQLSKETSDIVCKSAIYYEIEKECIIASQSRRDIPELFIDDDQATYIENTCIGSPNDVEKLQSTTTIRPTKATKPLRKDHLSTPSNSTRKAALKKVPVNNVELSGYDSPMDFAADRSGATETATSRTTKPTTTERIITPIDVKVIDTYNADAAVKTPIDISYGKRLRDSRIKDCFTWVLQDFFQHEVRPLLPMEQTRITKAYSLEQCTDICRLCWRCLRGRKCLGVAFDVSGDQCALSSKHIVDGGSTDDLDPIVYHNRIDC